MFNFFSSVFFCSHLLAEHEGSDCSQGGAGAGSDWSEPLQDALSTACEYYWSSKLPGREGLVCGPILYLLAHSLGDASKASDIHRVHHVREAFGEFTSGAGEALLKRLLQRCVISPTYLRSPEGVKVLAAAFVHGSCELIESMHASVKNQLPYMRKSMVESYGEMYFKAWHNAVDPQLERIEYGCIEDVMANAVGCANNNTASALRSILGYLHTQKKQAGVDEMLSRLYEPILWRSLKASNPSVRSNAAKLFIDAFPLVDQA